MSSDSEKCLKRKAECLFTNELDDSVPKIIRVTPYNLNGKLIFKQVVKFVA